MRLAVENVDPLVQVDVVVDEVVELEVLLLVKAAEAELETDVDDEDAGGATDDGGGCLGANMDVGCSSAAEADERL